MDTAQTQTPAPSDIGSGSLTTMRAIMETQLSSLPTQNTSSAVIGQQMFKRDLTAMIRSFDGTEEQRLDSWIADRDQARQRYIWTDGITLAVAEAGRHSPRLERSRGNKLPRMESLGNTDDAKSSPGGTTLSSGQEGQYKEPKKAESCPYTLSISDKLACVVYGRNNREAVAFIGAQF